MQFMFILTNLYIIYIIIIHYLNFLLVYWQITHIFLPGINDNVDNCDFDANPLQENSDGDAQGGDACDTDDENDGRRTMLSCF